MKEGCSEFFEPFYIPASAAGTGAVIKIKAQAAFPGVLELQVVSGGPVFLFRGEKSLKSAYDATHVADAIDFDLACAVSGRGEIGLESGIGLLTLQSDNESIGFIRFRRVY